MTTQVTLADVYADDCVYSGFVPRDQGRWVARDPSVRYAMTGGPVLALGGLPAIVAEGAIRGTRTAADLLPEGLAPDWGLVIGFTDDGGYQRAIDRVIATGHRVVTQHRHPPQLLPPRTSWIDPDLQGRLNNKALLAHWTPTAHVARRLVGDPRDRGFRERICDLGLPVAVKVATEWSTGGGSCDVVIAQSPSERENALEAFADSGKVVAEEWIAADRHVCVSAVARAAGEVRVIGAAEIVSAGNGSYHGNWLGDVVIADDTVAAVRTIAESAAMAGYRGLLGVDVAERDGRTAVVYDLNFRLCGSTAPLLILDALAQRVSTCRLGTWVIAGRLLSAMPALERARDLGLLPTCVFDPEPHGSSDAVRVTGLLQGTSREEVAAMAADLSELGLMLQSSSVDGNEALPR